jgi:hypothetical protein
VSDKRDESKASELLRTMGRVSVPEHRVLDDAREVLWTAIASEMLGIGPADDRATARRRQAGQSPDQRKMSAGGGGPGS